MHPKLKSTDLHQFRPHHSTARRTNNYHNLPLGLFPVMPDLSTRFHLEPKSLFPETRLMAPKHAHSTAGLEKYAACKPFVQGSAQRQTGKSLPLLPGSG